MTSQLWRDDVLLMSLAVAVPIEIGNLRWSDAEARIAIAARFQRPGTAADPGSGEEIAGRGYLQECPGGGYRLGDMDSMLYGGRGCAAAFANVAKVLALLAYQPGGVRFGPLRWCAAHMQERWMEPDGQVCPACLREETSGKHQSMRRRRQPDAHRRRGGQPASRPQPPGAAGQAPSWQGLTKTRREKN